MPTALSLHEPTPHHPTTLPFGRGGAGNRTHPTPPSTLTSTSYKITLPTTASSFHKSAFSTGRGGAGNMHSSDSERRLFSFDEELERQQRRPENVAATTAAAAAGHCAPVYHIGRGGQGNLIVDDVGAAERRRRRGSESGSEGSERGGVRRGSLEWIKGIATGGRKGGA